MYKCEICGREIAKKHSLYGYKCLCSKHMHQLFSHGKFLDTNPRTQQDLNEFTICGDVVVFTTYDQSQNPNDKFIIDYDDLDKVRYKKWRISRGYPITGRVDKNHRVTLLSHLILGCDTDVVVDHINGNPKDNRKQNLRICTQADNTVNKSDMKLNTTGVIGVWQDKRQGRVFKWCAEIRKGGKRVRLGEYLTIEEAAYARYIGELKLFGEFRNTKHDEEKMNMFNTLTNGQKEKVTECVNRRFNKLNIQSA